MKKTALEVIEALHKKFGGTIAGPDHPIYQQSYQISFIKGSRRASASTSTRDSAGPVEQAQQPDQEESSSADTAEG